MNSKQNDWLATLLFQPDMTLQDFYNNNITPENTTLQSREYYKQKPKIIDAFTKDGKFEDNIFENFYQSALSMYNVYANQQFEDTLSETFSYDPFNRFAPAGSKTSDVLPRVKLSSNNYYQGIGLTGINSYTGTTRSARSIAQENRVWDPQVGEFLDWTPEDRGGFLKGLIRPTLALAIWDSDGEHEIDGRTIKHQKGDLRVDDNGDYFYELLGNKSTIGRDILPYTDTLTRESSWMHKYDFMDSDDLEKTVAGTISKLVVSVAPLFIPGVGWYYGAATAGVQLAKLAPSLIKAVNGIVGGDTSDDNTFIQKLNVADSWMARFTPSVSDYSRDRIATIENLGVLLKDVSMQLYQQRLMGEIPRWFTGREDRAIRKLGQTMSLAYMSGISSQEVYDEFKQAGASDRVAGLGMIASIGAMYKLMSIDYFRDMLFRGTYLDESPARLAPKMLGKKALLDQASKSEIAAFTASGVKQNAKFVQKWTNKLVEKMGNSAYLSRSVNEALEETAEEMSADLVKALALGADALGFSTTTDGSNLNFDYTVSDVLQRYGMAFAGGALGGPVFELHMQYQNYLGGINNKLAKMNVDNVNEQLVYLIRNGYVDEVREGVNKLMEKGKLGSTSLSGNQYEVVDGKIKFHEAKSNDSQNTIIGKAILDYIDNVEEVMGKAALYITDEELELLQAGVRADGSKMDPIAEKVIQSGVASKIFREYSDLAGKVVSLTGAINEEAAKIVVPSDSQEKQKEQADQNSKIQALRKQLNETKQKLEDITEGKYAADYLGQALFILDKNINSLYTTATLEDYTQAMYSRSFNSLDEETKNLVTANFDKFKNADLQDKLYEAYELHKSLSKLMKSDLEDFSNLKAKMSKVFQSGTLAFEGLSEILVSITELEEKITEEKAKDKPNVEKISKWEADIEEKGQILEIMNANKSSYLIPNMTEEGQTILGRFLDDTEQKQKMTRYADGILKLLKHTRDNKMIIDVSDNEVNTLLNQWKQLWVSEGTDISSLFVNRMDMLARDEQHNWTDVTDEYGGMLNVESLSIHNNPDFMGLLAAFDINLGTDVKKALNVWEEIQHKVKESVKAQDANPVDSDGNPIDLAQAILDGMLPSIGNLDVVEYLKKYLNLKGQNIHSPVFEMLNKFSTSISGNAETLINLLNQEESNFVNAESIESYIIQNPEITAQLLQLGKMIDMTQAVVNSATTLGDLGSFNAAINNRAGHKKVAELDMESGLILSAELLQLKTKVDFLLDLSDGNRQQKLRNQRDVAINIRQLQKDVLTFDDSTLRQNFEKAFPEVDLREIWKELSKVSTEINDSNYHTFEESVIKLETEIWEKLGKKYTSEEELKELAKKLVGLFPKNTLYKLRSTKLSRHSPRITEYDQLVYLASLISKPSEDFYARLKDVVEDKEFDLAPVFGQEYASRVIDAQISNPKLFNNILDLITQDEIGDPYINNRSVLHNFVWGIGSAGSGKTKGIGNVIMRIIGKDAQVLTVAPALSQAQNLAKGIGREAAPSFTKDAFITNINGGNPLTADYFHNWDQSIEGSTGNVTLNENVNPPVTNLFEDNGTKRFLFLDEVSLFHEGELKFLSKWAENNDVMVIAFGDLKQNMAKVKWVNSKGELKVINGGIDGTVHIKSPSLTAAFRPANIAKAENAEALATLLDDELDNFSDDITMSLGERAAYITDKLNEMKGIVLKYYDSETEFAGEMMLNDFEKFVRKMQNIATNNPNAKMALVTEADNVPDIPNVRRVPEDVIQGDEFDYVFIYKPWSTNAYIAAQDLYTMIQRSTKGTIIYNRPSDNTLAKVLPQIRFEFRNGVNKSIEIPSEALTEFKEWRLRGLANLQKSSEEVAGPQKESTEPVEQPTPAEQPISRPKYYTPTQTASNTTSAEINNNSVVSESGDLNTEEDKPNPNQEIITKANVQTEGNVAPKATKTPVKPVVNKVITTTLPVSTKTELSLNSTLMNAYYGEDGERKPFWERRAEPTSLFKELHLNDLKMPVDKYQTLLQTLGSYYMFNHHDIEGKTLNEIGQKQLMLKMFLTDIFSFQGGNTIVNDLMTGLVSRPIFEIVPYEDKHGLLVSSFNVNNKKVSIPLFITEPSYGVLEDARFVKVKGPTMGVKENTLFPLKLNGRMQYFEKVFAFMAGKDVDDTIFGKHNQRFLHGSPNYDENGNYIGWTKGTKGKAMIAFTDDLFTGYQDFITLLQPSYASNNSSNISDISLEHVKTSGDKEGMTYLVHKGNKFALMGVQRPITFSEWVLQARKQISLLKRGFIATNSQTKDENFIIEYGLNQALNKGGKKVVFDKFDSNINQIVFENTTDAFFTELLRLTLPDSEISDYQRSELRKVYSNLWGYLMQQTENALAGSKQYNNNAIVIEVIKESQASNEAEEKYKRTRWQGGKGKYYIQLKKTNNQGDKLVLYRFDGHTKTGDGIAEIGVPAQIAEGNINIYSTLMKFIEEIGRDDESKRFLGEDLAENLKPDNILMYLAEITPNTVFAASSNRTVEMLTRGMNEGTLGEFDKVFEEVKFKNDFYANDPVDNTAISPYIKPVIVPIEEYLTDRPNPTFSQFKINRKFKSEPETEQTLPATIETTSGLTEEISTEVSEETQVNAEEIIETTSETVTEDITEAETQLSEEETLRQTLSDNDINYAFKTPIKDIQQLVQRINKKLQSTQNEPILKQLTSIDTVEATLNWSNLIENFLKGKNIEYSNYNLITGDPNRNYAVFFIENNEVPSGYRLMKRDGVWDMYDFNSFPQYKNLVDFINEDYNGLYVTLDKMSRQYLGKLLYEGEIEAEHAQGFYDFVSQNLGDENLSRLNNLVNEYLLQRIKNNEC